MIAFILKVSLCWLFFYGIYELFLKNKTFFNANRSYLLITLAAGIILPLLEFIPWKNDSNVAHVIYPMLMEIDDLQAVVASRTPEKFDWSILLYIIYGVGFSLSMFKFSLGLQKIIKLFKYSTKLKNEGYTLVMTEEQHLPFSFFKWVFFSKTMTLSEEVDRILTHEIEHIKGRHSFDVLATELLKVVFWCSPMIYLYRSALKEVHEYLADHVVVKSSDKLSYKKLLLDQTNSGLQMALTHQFFNSHLKNRLKMISQKRSGRPTLVMYALGIPVLLLLLFAFTYALQPETQGEQGTFYESIKTDLAFDYVKFADETDQSKMPYIQVNGEDIEYPLSDHIDIYGKVGTVCSYVPDYATEMHGEKAKLGYINLQDPTFKKKSENLSVSERILNRFQAKKDTVPSTSGSIDWDKAEIFKVVEEMPRFPGCEDVEGGAKEKEECAKGKMLEFIYKNLQYPKEDREAGIQGMAVAQFVITNKGELENLKIVRSISDGTDQSVLKVLTDMNALPQKWRPGYQRGKAVNVLYTLPVRFKLQEDEDNEEDKHLKIERHSVKGVVISDNIKGFDVKGPDFQIALTYSPIISSPAIFVNDEMWFGPLSDIELDKMSHFEFTHPRPTRQTSGKKTAPVFNFTTNDAVNLTALKIGNKSDKIVIRSEGNDTQPLFVIDGKVTAPLTREEINPDDIASINVLKGEAADKKYGDKGLNGVVEITTKEGLKKEKANTGKPFDTPAYFPGCSDEQDLLKKDKCSKQNLLNYIYSNLKYPKDAREKGVEGMIVTKFIIGADGRIKTIDILRAVEGLTKAASETVTKMADETTWEPAMKDGKAVAMEFTLPIKFKIPETPVQVEPVYTKCDQIEDEKLRAKCKEESKAILKDKLEDIDAEIRQNNTLAIESVTVYPNPAKESINVKFKAAPKPIAIQIFTIDGKSVYQKNYPKFSGAFNEMIDLKNVNTTMLLLQIKQDGEVFTEKIIVK